MAFEAYRIAVRLSLIENVTAGLTRLSAHFAQAGTNADALQKRLDKIAKMTLVGGALAATGGVLLKSLQAPLEEAKKFQTEQARFAALGLGDKALDDATKYAKGMNIIGNSARDNLKLLREATTITGDLHHAEAIAPLLAKMRFGIRSVMGDEHAGSFDKQFADAIKVTELRGALVNRTTGEIDPASFSRVLNLMTQAYVASGGLVKPSDYLAAIKTGGVSAKLMKDESFFLGMGHFMQESGGSRTGTAMMSQFQNWVMGRMPQRVAEDLSKLGLLNQGALHYGTTGHITRVDTGGLLRSQEFVDNPFKYMNEVVVPKLQAQGFKGDALNLKLASLFGIRTASNLADQFVREQKVADNYITRSRRAADVESLYKLGGGTLAGKEIDLQAKWADLMRELGTTILPVAISFLEKLNSGLKSLIGFAHEHPTLTKFAMAGVAVVGVLATLGGTLLLVRAGLMALSPLLGVASGVGLAGLLGKAGLAGAAAVGVYQIGRLVVALADLWGATHHDGVKLTPEAQDRLNDPRLKDLDKNFRGGGGGATGAWGDPVRSSASQPTQLHTDVHLDGQKIASVVTRHQERKLQGAQTGSRWFDSGQSLPPVNLAY